MEKQETKICQNCKSEFTIEPEDFQFYEKLKVPAPTFCPDCRLQRRLTFRNERTLYKDKCDLTGKSIISMYAPGHPFPVYTPEAWRSDKWDQMTYGQDYNFSKPFFSQFQELLKKVPRMSLGQTNGINADYANYILDVKNVYLAYSVIYGSEDVYYSKIIDGSKDIVDCFDVYSSEHCYEMIDGKQNYNCSFVYFSNNCIDSSFLFDCANCQSCFGCVNLRNKSYYIFGKPYTKETYQEEVKKLTGSYKALQEAKKLLREQIAKTPRKYARTINCVNSTGDDLRECKNVKNCFSTNEAENCSYVFRSPKLKDSMDATHAGKAEQMYEYITGGGAGSSLIRFTVYGLGNLIDTFYTDYCQNSSNLFGCIGLRNKQYCILNKQYSKEEYESLIPRIIKHMNEMPYIDKKGRTYKFGEFFPSEFSPVSYNESAAIEYFPLSREDAVANGYLWLDSNRKTYSVTLSGEKIPDSISDTSDNILSEVIGCDHAGSCNHECVKVFRIISQEFSFYKKLNIPLPHLCPNCRYFERIKQRNPIRLFDRACQCTGETSDNKIYQNTGNHIHGKSHCPNKFETAYAPDRPEIVYCEACYQAEVI